MVNQYCEESHEEKKCHKMKVTAVLVLPGLEEQVSRFSPLESLIDGIVLTCSNIG